ncbi:hypothetical protein H8E77_36125 [bacterium]|nr:hypothetical protein [bacterium]
MILISGGKKIEEEVLNDSIAVSEDGFTRKLVNHVARALTCANKKAEEYEMDIRQSLISITQEIQENKDMIWRVHYGPIDYIRRRGGDLIVYVDPHDYTIRKVLRGQ